MDLKVVNAFLCEYVRPEPAAKFTALGIPLVIYLKDVAKPCYPLFSFIHLQGVKPGQGELTFRLRDEKTKKEVAAYKTPLQVKGNEQKIKQEGFYNLVQIQVLKKVVFGKAGTFQIIIAIDNNVKKSYKISVVEVKK